VNTVMYRDADKSLTRPTSRYILFEGENISFDASLFIYINSTNIPPIMIINRIYEHQNLLSLYIFFLPGRAGRTYQQWRTQEFCSWGFQQIQMRTEDREDGDLGAVAP